MNSHINKNSKSFLNINEEGSLKKSKKLRKNFDMLVKAIKNPNTSKKEKIINFTSD